MLYNNWPIFQFLSSSASQCNNALGMESGEIRDNQITAYKTDVGNGYKARLNNPDGDYWSAGSGSSVSELGSIQVDLGSPMSVTQVATQVEEVNGRHSIDFHVSYKMQQIDDWEPIKMGDGQNHVSEQNSTNVSVWIMQVLKCGI